MNDITKTTGVVEDFAPKPLQSFLRYVGVKKKFYIFNHTDYNIKVIVSPGEITNLSGVKLGPAEFNLTYDTPHDSTQESTILARGQRKIYTSSRDSYVTIFLKHQNEWIILFKNRRHSIANDLNIFNRHIREALA